MTFQVDIIRTSYFMEGVTLLHSAKQSRIMQNMVKICSGFLMVVTKCLVMGSQHAGG